ncbi:MAG: SDR family NAD(P)-dependent oxidoreductase, partial [Gemmobacter sp.]
MTAAVSVALVTGAGAGLGAALAQALTARGHAVLGIARGAAGLAETADRCAPGLFHAQSADVTDAAALRRIVAEAERDIGPVAILINNAAVYHRA